MKKLGVIGGMGPMATAYFYELLIKLTKADSDQEHPEVLIYSRPSIPDRTAYILGKSSLDPITPIIEAGDALVRIGAELLAIPCITSHHFYDELVKAINVPIIHLIRETVKNIEALGVRSFGLAATEGTIASGVFHKELEACGIRTVLPSADKQSLIMELIYWIKAGRPADMEKFTAVTDELTDNGADVIILGCTELSLINREHMLTKSSPAGRTIYVDPLEILASRSLELCGAPRRLTVMEE